MTSDNNKNNKDESFDLLVHEQKISDMYQSDKTEQPSALIDAKILAAAKLQLAEKAGILAQPSTAQPSPKLNKHAKNKTQKIWKWPVSLAASVGILGVLFITQSEFFIQPNSIVLSEPSVRSSDNFVIAKDAAEIVFNKPVSAMQLTAKKHPTSQLLEQEFSAAASKRMAANKKYQESQMQMADSLMRNEDLAKVSGMSLADMSKLAESITQQLNKQRSLKIEENSQLLNMQQNLFKSLLTYQVQHEEFSLTEKYLSVLTETQIQQIKDVKPTNGN